LPSQHMTRPLNQISFSLRSRGFSSPSFGIPQTMDVKHQSSA
jgi:hypothetical protein